MNIVVLVKQVPEIALIKVNEAEIKIDLPQCLGLVNLFNEYLSDEGFRIILKTSVMFMFMAMLRDRS